VGLRLAAVAAFLLYGGWNLWIHVMRPAVVAAEWGADGRWRLRLRGSSGWVEARAAPDAFVTRHLAVLRFRLASGRRARLLVMPDAVSRETRRRLALRWRAGPAADAGIAR
jgi:hypothetical protein